MDMGGIKMLLTKLLTRAENEEAILWTGRRLVPTKLRPHDTASPMIIATTIGKYSHKSQSDTENVASRGEVEEALPEGVRLRPAAVEERNSLFILVVRILKARVAVCG